MQLLAHPSGDRDSSKVFVISAADIMKCESHATNVD